MFSCPPSLVVVAAVVAVVKHARAHGTHTQTGSFGPCVFRFCSFSLFRFLRVALSVAFCFVAI